MLLCELFKENRDAFCIGRKEISDCPDKSGTNLKGLKCTVVWKVTVWVSQAAGSCKRPFLSNVNAARPTLLQGQEGICLWGLKVPWKQVIQFACKNLVLIASCLTEDQMEFLCNSGCARENVRSLQEESFCVAVDTVTWLLWDGSSRPQWFYMRNGLFLGTAQGLVRSSWFSSRFQTREDWNLVLYIKIVWMSIKVDSITSKIMYLTQLIKKIIIIN